MATIMPKDIKPNRRAPIWPRDKSGKMVEQDLLDAADRNWTRIRAYADRHQQDPSLTANLLETTLVALSRARNSNRRLIRPIRNLDNYLYSAFIRRTNRKLARKPKVETVGSLHDLDTFANRRTRPVSPSIERELLIKEVMTFLDENPRQMSSLRRYGCSWGEVAGLLKITVNTAQVRFNRGLKRAKNRVMKPQGGKKTPGKGGAAHE